ncbi:MAG: PadR family transcriptional regulator [Gemmatimonadota bacterium]
MTRPKRDLLQGTLDLLILQTLQIGEPMHGWGVAQRIQQLSEDVLQLNQGSLYPALHRLEGRGWIRAEWGQSANKRRAKFYRLTALGRSHLAEETEQWDAFAAAVQRILTAR